MITVNVSRDAATPAHHFRETVAPAKAAYPPVSEKPAPAMPFVSVTGAFVGTVHNQTVNLSSTFTVVIHQAKTGVLDGCMEVKPPLYGSGALRGSVRGSHITFVVADITFQGDASKSVIAGSYVVTRQEGNQLGEFHLMKQASAELPLRGRSLNCGLSDVQ